MPENSNKTSSEMNRAAKKRRPPKRGRRSLSSNKTVDSKGNIRRTSAKKKQKRQNYPGKSEINSRSLPVKKNGGKIAIAIGIGLVALAIIAIVVCLVASLIRKNNESKAEQAALESEEEALYQEKLEEEADREQKEQYAKEATARLEETDSLEEAWESMWLEKVELPTESTSDFAILDKCLISEDDPSKVIVSGTLPGIPDVDDENLYLFALNTYDTGIADGDSPIASYRIDKTSETYEIEANLNYNKSSSILNKKMVVAVKQNDQYVMITGTSYITNPEARASYNSYKQASSKKGFIVDAARLNSGELEDLGIKQAAYNIWVGRLLNTSSGAISYSYNGKTYYFNKSDVASYDIIFSTLSAKGIKCTAVVLNDMNSAHMEMIHPNARGGSASYYMFNAATSDGVETLAAVSSFLAERYSGNHGTVSNWIFANEINARKEWNYYENTDVNSYVSAYAQGFRVFYNSIKSINGSARVYMPLDQTWNRNIDSKSGDYDARDVLDAFNSIIKEKGNIDWDLAYHPYSVPLTRTDFWNGYKNLVLDSVDTPMVSMKNINIVTSYLCNETFLKSDGTTREVVLSEQGYTSSAGQDNQAAAIGYAYKIAEANSHINGFILNRQIDASAEIAQGLALGLMNTGGGHKKSYEVYKYIDTSEWESHMEFAKSIIGISDWTQAIKSY